MPNLRSLALAVVVFAFVGCSAAGPTSSPLPTATSVAATPSPAATAAPTSTPEPSPIIYTEIQKLAEGGHGGEPPLDLPAAFVIDYAATGTCEFTIQVIAPEAGTVVASLAMDVTGTTVSGRWPVNIQAGSYSVGPGEAVGCTFHLVVHGPAAPTPGPTGGPTPVVYLGLEKISDGPHGFPGAVDLPAHFVVDYRVTGTCAFAIDVAKATPDVGASIAKLALSMTGSTATGTWSVTVPAGSYFVRPAEAVGCTYSVSVRAPS